MSWPVWWLISLYSCPGDQDSALRYLEFWTHFYAEDPRFRVPQLAAKFFRARQAVPATSAAQMWALAEEIAADDDWEGGIEDLQLQSMARLRFAAFESATAMALDAVDMLRVRAGVDRLERLRLQLGDSANGADQILIRFKEALARLDFVSDEGRAW